MYICKNCGQRFAAYTNFCNTCGSSMIEPEEAPISSYSHYDSVSISPAPAGGKPQSIVSMILGIEAICGSIASLIYAIMAMVIADNYSTSYYSPYSYYDSSAAYTASSIAGAAIFFAIFHLVLGIVALILGCVARSKGSRSSMAGAGKALGIVSTILSAISFLLAVTALSM